jgi:hypothetical protein
VLAVAAHAVSPSLHAAAPVLSGPRRGRHHSKQGQKIRGECRSELYSMMVSEFGLVACYEQVLGNEHSEGTGLGNFLVFFPALYYFAAFTNRDIVIADNSIVGEMCQMIHCGFPFLSGSADASVYFESI